MQSCGSGGKSFRKNQQVHHAYSKMLKKIRSIPPNGIVPGPYQTDLQVLFSHKGKTYRIDVENIKGHNLRR